MHVGVHDGNTPSTNKADWPGVNTHGPLFIGKVAPTDDVWKKINNAAGPAWAAGLAPLVTVKFNVAATMAGQFDQQLATIKANLATKPFTILYPWHEPEDDMPGRTFVPYFDYVYSRLHDDKGTGGNPQTGVGATKRWWVGWAAMSYAWRPNKGSDDMWVGDPSEWQVAATDFVSCHVYSGRSWPSSWILPEHLPFLRWKREVCDVRTDTGGDFAVTERGFKDADNMQRAGNIERERDWLVNSGAQCKLYQYWDTVGTEGDSGWLLDPIGEGAVKSLVTATAGL